MKKLGFTLVELLVVVSIVSLLSSVVTASLGGARLKAKNSALQAQNQQYILAMVVYSDSNGGFPPSSSGTQVGNYVFVCLGTGCIYGSTPITSSIASLPNNSRNTASALSSYISISENNTANLSDVTIDGSEYKGTVYTCLTYASNGKCAEPQMFFPLANTATCPDGASVALSDANGVLCTENVKEAAGAASGAANTNGGSGSVASSSGVTFYDASHYRYSSPDSRLGGFYGNGWNGQNLYYSNSTGNYLLTNSGSSCISVYDYFGADSGAHDYCLDQNQVVFYDGDTYPYASDSDFGSGTGYGSGWDGTKYYDTSRNAYTYTTSEGTSCLSFDYYNSGSPTYNTSYCSVPNNNPVEGCTDSLANNYNSSATIDNGSCTYDNCTDPSASNYNQNNGACQYGTFYDGSTYPFASTDSRLSNNLGNGWDGSNLYYSSTLGIYNQNSGGTCFTGDDYNVGNNLNFCTGDSGIVGCMDPLANNYNSGATISGSCTYDNCTDPAAINYNQNNGSCVYDNCTDPSADNYNSNNGSCQYSCHDINANNYGQSGSCTYDSTCNDPSANNYQQSGSCTYGGYCSNPNHNSSRSDCETDHSYCSDSSYHDESSCTSNGTYSGNYCSGGGYQDPSSCTNAGYYTDPYCTDSNYTDSYNCTTYGNDGAGAQWVDSYFVSYGYTWTGEYYVPNTWTSDPAGVWTPN